jgi:hypothetical protein
MMVGRGFEEGDEWKERGRKKKKVRSAGGVIPQGFQPELDLFLVCSLSQNLALRLLLGKETKP